MIYLLILMIAAFFVFAIYQIKKYGWAHVDAALLAQDEAIRRMEKFYMDEIERKKHAGGDSHEN